MCLCAMIMFVVMFLCWLALIISIELTNRTDHCFQNLRKEIERNRKSVRERKSVRKKREGGRERERIKFKENLNFYEENGEN